MVTRSTPATAQSASTAATSSPLSPSPTMRPLLTSGRAASPARPLVKSGLMVGLGESGDEVAAVLADCAVAGVDLVTIGQYLQPDRACLPVARYVDPTEFHAYERQAGAIGLQVLTDGHQVDAGHGAVGEHGGHFVAALAESDHEAALDQRARRRSGARPGGGAAQQLQRAAVPGLRPHLLVQARHRLEVVVEDGGPASGPAACG